MLPRGTEDNRPCCTNREAQIQVKAQLCYRDTRTLTQGASGEQRHLVVTGAGLPLGPPLPPQPQGPGTRDQGPGTRDQGPGPPPPPAPPQEQGTDQAACLSHAGSPALSPAPASSSPASPLFLICGGLKDRKITLSLLLFSLKT